jgi:hypothetical protein
MLGINAEWPKKDFNKFRLLASVHKEEIHKDE